MKNAFTLMELIMIIVILGLIALIAIPTVNSIIKDSKEKAYQEQVDLIEKTAKNYMTMDDNLNLLSKAVENQICIPIDNLKKAGLLSNENIINPKTKEIMNGCVSVSYNGKKYIYKYSE